MRVVVQRVRSASVTIAGEPVGEIGRGLVLLIAIAPTDTATELGWMARKCLDLRLFPDESTPKGQFDRSVTDIGGEILAVSQFTLYGDCRKGRRPDFTGSAPGDRAEALYDQFVELLRGGGLTVATGRFGASMAVELVNDGPVTLVIDRDR
jgi:D-tyrosyl-tRNA(Tyr) deacylase